MSNRYFLYILKETIDKIYSSFLYNFDNPHTLSHLLVFLYLFFNNLIDSFIDFLCYTMFKYSRRSC